MKDQATQRSTPDSAAPNPVSGRSHSRRIETNHPTWTGYWTDPARFMATPINQLIILTETAGSLNKPASSTPNTGGGDRQATGMTERFTNETLGVRSNLHSRINYSQNGNSNPASAAHSVHLQNLYRAYIIMHSRYHGHWRKHTTDKPASTPVTFFIHFFLPSLSLKNR